MVVIIQQKGTAHKSIKQIGVEIGWKRSSSKWKCKGKTNETEKKPHSTSYEKLYVTYATSKSQKSHVSYMLTSYLLWVLNSDQ